MTENTRVVHVRDNVPGAIYIGRAMPRQRLKASPFANPHKIGKPDPIDGHPMGRYAACRAFSQDLQGAKRHLFALLPALRNLPLACWCRHDGEALSPDTWCHGDVLKHFLDTYTDDELRAMAQEAAP